MASKAFYHRQAKLPVLTRLGYIPADRRVSVVIGFFALSATAARERAASLQCGVITCVIRLVKTLRRLDLKLGLMSRFLPLKPILSAD
jgi:hypothetical protein